MNIEELREFCMALPGVTEDVKWGNDHCFSVGKKMFTVTGVDGDGGISVKTTPEKFAELLSGREFGRPIMWQGITG
jgi:predicted DNA-binding protein (MmcQ/YjbR family)